MRGISTSRGCAREGDCLAAAGLSFVIRYASRTTRIRSKVMSSYEARALVASGGRLGTVYQDRARQPEDFSLERGRRDAVWARRWARALRQPFGSTVFFAVDFDADSGVVDGPIQAYFRGVREVMSSVGEDGPYRVGIYGSGLACERILAAGLVDDAWLAMARGWQGSADYEGWHIRQSGPDDALCDLNQGYENCVLRDGVEEHCLWVPDMSLGILDPSQQPVLSQGSEGEDVVFLQQLLNGWLDEENATRLLSDGDFGPRTRKATKAFQAHHTDRLGDPLRIDGEVGGRTWGSLLRYSAGEAGVVASHLDDLGTVMPAESAGGTARGRAALAMAIGELAEAAREIGGNNRGPFVEKYLRPVLDPFRPEPWCAGFVSWCFRESGPMPFSYTLGARALLNQLREQGDAWEDPLGRSPEPGDLVFWWRDNPAGWQGHVGLVHHVSEGDLVTIEGNKAGRVRTCRYPLVSVARLLGFARIE